MLSPQCDALYDQNSTIAPSRKTLIAAFKFVIPSVSGCSIYGPGHCRALDRNNYWVFGRGYRSDLAAPAGNQGLPENPGNPAQIQITLIISYSMIMLKSAPLLRSLPLEQETLLQ